jgi:hypothetical protein
MEVMQASDPSEKPPMLLSRRPDPQYVAAVLDEWMHGDAAEQRETFELLKRSLDADRPDGYKLFP